MIFCKCNYHTMGLSVSLASSWNHNHPASLGERPLVFSICYCLPE